mmetsp:Transcript_26186/g.62280  ORF Transcript_26186/g.62280 Transcript_26186/m.62280 type:complete len:213 (-) Transcript_26186:972-1610(-)
MPVQLRGRLGPPQREQGRDVVLVGDARLQGEDGAVALEPHPVLAVLHNELCVVSVQNEPLAPLAPVFLADVHLQFGGHAVMCDSALHKAALALRENLVGAFEALHWHIRFADEGKLGNPMVLERILQQYLLRLDHARLAPHHVHRVVTVDLPPPPHALGGEAVRGRRVHKNGVAAERVLLKELPPHPLERHLAAGQEEEPDLVGPVGAPHDR